MIDSFFKGLPFIVLLGVLTLGVFIRHRRGDPVTVPNWFRSYANVGVLLFVCFGLSFFGLLGAFPGGMAVELFHVISPTTLSSDAIWGCAIQSSLLFTVCALVAGLRADKSFRAGRKRTAAALFVGIAVVIPLLASFALFTFNLAD